MPLPPPAPRTLAHTREVVYHGYHREDGLWDIEARMFDKKTHPFHRVQELVQPGEHSHNMEIRLTIDDSMTVVAAAAVMNAKPFVECEAGQSPFAKMVGVRMGSGWRQAVERAMGGDTGCTHLRELLTNMATAAFQTLPAYKRYLIRVAGKPVPQLQAPGFHMGRCIGWAFDGPVMARHYPQFVGWKEKKAVEMVARPKPAADAAAAAPAASPASPDRADD